MRRICTRLFSSAHSSWPRLLARVRGRGAAAASETCALASGQSAPHHQRLDACVTPTRRASPSEVAGRRNRPAQRGELRLVEALQASIGAFQRNDRGLDVACQLQLLRGGEQHLLDFGQRPLVPPLRHILVQGLERELLLLRRHHLASMRHLLLTCRIVLGLRASRRVSYVLARFGESAPEFGLEVADALVAVEPRPGRGGQRQRGSQQGEQRRRGGMGTRRCGCRRSGCLRCSQRGGGFGGVIHGLFLNQLISPSTRPASPPGVAMTVQ
jgi:hypothetical protein